MGAMGMSIGVTVAVLVSLFISASLITPDCHIRPDVRSTRLALALSVVGGLAVEVGLVVGAVALRRRLTGGPRAAIGVALPFATGYGLFVWGQMVGLAIVVLGAEGGSSACW